MVTLGSYPILECVFGLVFVHLCPMWIYKRVRRFASSSLVCVKLYSMKEEKTKIVSYGVMFSLYMFSFIFADFQDKPMGAVNVFTNRNL